MIFQYYAHNKNRTSLEGELLGRDTRPFATQTHYSALPFLSPPTKKKKCEFALNRETKNLLMRTNEEQFVLVSPSTMQHVFSWFNERSIADMVRWQVSKHVLSEHSQTKLTTLKKWKFTCFFKFMSSMRFFYQKPAPCQAKKSDSITRTVSRNGYVEMSSNVYHS